MSWQTLGLTSPLARGDRVREAQRLLTRNRFATDFLDDDVDGAYGPATFRGVKRAKYWLGYPEGRINGRFGATLRRYLADGELPVGHRLRRRARLRRRERQRQMPRRLRALEVARSQIGTTESPPGSNQVKYASWYGMPGQPWCAMFASWCYAQAGSRFRAAWCPGVVAWARAGEAGCSVTRSPQPGDWVLFDWDGGVSDHVGLFEKWTDRAAGRFQSVEGNTALGNDSNGGEVMRRDRHVSQVEAFVHVSA